MNANRLSHRSPVKASRGSHRTSRSFRPSADGLEQRLALSGIGVSARPPMADIIVENLTVQDLGNDTFKVTATLANELPNPVPSTGLSVPPKGSTPVGVDYPGGGIFSLVRSTGGTTITNPPGDIAPTIQDPGHALATMRIPAIPFHQSVQLSAVTQGRAVFTASARASVPLIGPAAPFPDSDLHDNVRTLSSLISHRVTLNSSSLDLIEKLRTPLADTEIRFFGPNSTITIPGVFTHHFSVPLYRMSANLGVTTVENDYLLSGLISYLSPVENAVSYENGGLAVSVRFADNPHALKSYNYLFPDIGVTHLKVKIFLPLNYNAHYQYFFIGTPKVEVTGQWQTSSPYGDLYNQVVVPITKQIADGVTASMLAGKGAMEHLLNQSIHDLANGGRIVSANVMTNETLLAFETPN